MSAALSTKWKPSIKAWSHPWPCLSSFKYLSVFIRKESKIECNDNIFDDNETSPCLFDHNIILNLDTPNHALSRRAGGEVR